MSSRTDLEVFERCTASFLAAVTFIAEDRLEAPTPCAEWNVADLLDHVTGGNRFTVRILSGEPASVAVQNARDSFRGDHHAVGAATESASEQLECVQSADLAATYGHVVGDLSGEQILRLRIHDLSIHTWDLLQAVNPAKGLDPVYVRWAVNELADPDSPTARHIATQFERPSKSFELLLAFGRRRGRSRYIPYELALGWLTV